MTYTFYNPSDGLYIIFDTASGAVIRASELEAYICEAMDPCGDVIQNLPIKCPSDLRYELARFSSTEVNLAYEKIKEYYSSGLIYNISPIILLRIHGDHSAEKNLIPIILAEANIDSEEVEYL